MKTHAKNLLTKFSRLQDRLLKYSALIQVVDGNGSFINDEAVKTAKKYYQFRFIDLQSIRKDTLGDVDRFVGAQAISLLIGDVNADITSVRTEIDALPATLNQKLSDYALRALNSSLLTTNEKKEYKDWWVAQIKYNIERLRVHIIQLKAGANQTKVLCDTLVEHLDRLILTFCSSDLAASQGEGSGPRVLEPSSEEVTTSQKKSRSQRRRQKRRQQKTKVVGCEGQEGNGIPSKERVPGQEARQKVFVNVHLDRTVEIPSIIFRTLNLGANFQLASIPKEQQIQRDWEKTRKTLETKAGQEFEEGQGKGVLVSSARSSFVNIVAAVSDRRIYNNNYINKKLLSNKALRTAANVNNAMRTVYDFLRDNNLFVILADKNLGLTIVDQDWYKSNMLKYFDNTDAFEYIPDWHTVNIVGRKLTYMPYVTLAETQLRTVVNEHFESKEHRVRYFMDAYWDWSNVNIPQAYGLIKLHKEPKKLRYITPVTDWVNVLVAKFIALKLQGFVEQIDWILPSSKELIPLIQRQTNRSL